MPGVDPLAQRRASRSRPATPRHSPKHCNFAPLAGPKACGGMPFPTASSGNGGGLEKPMPTVTVYGFPRSTFVHIARLVLEHKAVPYVFRDLEPEMGTPAHLALHPFDRVPILQHGDFTLYETSAISAYVDEVFAGAKLTPEDRQRRARMNQWISAVNNYYYPYMIYHVSHERNVFPQLGIDPD